MVQNNIKWIELNCDFIRNQQEMFDEQMNFLLKYSNLIFKNNDLRRSKGS
jgi:hypothetical protein